MKSGGHTETASLDDISLQLIQQYIGSLVGRGPDWPGTP
jgi:hypothetical protein